MKKILIGAVLACLVVPAAASAEDMGMSMGSTPADKAFAASMDKMMKGMGTKPSGDTDRDFVVMMIPHHQGAIDMAKVELQYGKDPMLRKLAGSIVDAQEREIGEMKDWLAKHAK